MRMYRGGVATLAILIAAGRPATAKAQSRDSTLLRATNVTVDITADPTPAYNGSYSAGGISTKCGLADYGYPHRLHSFAVMFPDDTATIAVTSVNFDADTLIAGTPTGSFYLSVGIRVGRTGTPPAYVIRANDPKYGEPGKATLTRLKNGADSLEVTGTATKGRKVSVKMVLVCQP